MSLVISLIYIVDIIILVFILGHRGHLHGAFEEMFHFISTIVAAFGAFTNFDWFASIIRNYWSPSGSLPEGIAFGLIYLIIWGALATTGLYLLSRIRQVELITLFSKIIGAILGAIKGLVVASVVLVLLYYCLPPFSTLSEPLRNPNDIIVQTSMKSAPNIYNIFVGIFGIDRLKFQG